LTCPPKKPLIHFSWNAYFCEVDENKIKQAIDAMVVFGLRGYGYEYVNSKYYFSDKKGFCKMSNPETLKFLHQSFI